MAQQIKNLPAMQETWVEPWLGKIPWRRERLHTSVLWPGEFLGLYSPWGHKESDTTERLSLSHTQKQQCEGTMKRQLSTSQGGRGVGEFTGILLFLWAGSFLLPLQRLPVSKNLMKNINRDNEKVVNQEDITDLQNNEAKTNNFKEK